VCSSWQDFDWHNASAVAEPLVGFAFALRGPIITFAYRLVFPYACWRRTNRRQLESRALSDRCVRLVERNNYLCCDNKNENAELVHWSHDVAVWCLVHTATPDPTQLSCHIVSASADSRRLKTVAGGKFEVWTRLEAIVHFTLPMPTRRDKTVLEQLAVVQAKTSFGAFVIQFTPRREWSIGRLFRLY